MEPTDACVRPLERNVVASLDVHAKQLQDRHHKATSHKQEMLAHVLDLHPNVRSRISSRTPSGAAPKSSRSFAMNSFVAKLRRCDVHVVLHAAAFKHTHTHRSVQRREWGIRHIRRISFVPTWLRPQSATERLGSNRPRRGRRPRDRRRRARENSRGPAHRSAACIQDGRRGMTLTMIRADLNRKCAALTFVTDEKQRRLRVTEKPFSWGVLDSHQIASCSVSHTQVSY